MNLMEKKQERAWSEAIKRSEEMGVEILNGLADLYNSVFYYGRLRK